MLNKSIFSDYGNKSERTFEKIIIACPGPMPIKHFPVFSGLPPITIIPWCLCPALIFFQWCVHPVVRRIDVYRVNSVLFHWCFFGDERTDIRLLRKLFQFLQKKLSELIYQFILYFVYLVALYILYVFKYSLKLFSQHIGLFK